MSTPGYEAIEHCAHRAWALRHRLNSLLDGTAAGTRSAGQKKLAKNLEAAAGEWDELRAELQLRTARDEELAL